jgi:hypothetical protein
VRCSFALGNRSDNLHVSRNVLVPWARIAGAAGIGGGRLSVDTDKRRRRNVIVYAVGVQIALREAAAEFENSDGLPRRFQWWEVVNRRRNMLT